MFLWESEQHGTDCFQDKCVPSVMSDSNIGISLAQLFPLYPENKVEEIIMINRFN